MNIDEKKHILYKSPKIERNSSGKKILKTGSNQQKYQDPATLLRKVMVKKEDQDPATLLRIENSLKTIRIRQHC